MLNVLVTGANGQLGRSIRLFARDTEKHRYVFTDVDELDIAQDLAILRQVVQSERIDVVVNCAAYTNVEQAEQDVDAACRINSVAVRNLATVVKEQNAVLFHISTDYVFDGTHCIPYVEEDIPRPLSVYGRSKYSGEQEILRSGCRFLILRTAWMYSPYGHNFFKTILNKLSQGVGLSVVADQIGTPTYAADLAHLIVELIESGDYIGHEGIYHFSNEGVCSWYDFAREIAVVSGTCDRSIKPCHTVDYKSNVCRPSYAVLDKTKVKKTFGIEIPHWRDALVRCWKAFHAEQGHSL